MKFRIKNYQSRISGKLYESYNVFLKKREKTWKRFLEMGHEKMTVMFIPHNEKRIFNFQISKFIILFFICLFFIGIVTSSYAVIKNRQIRQTEKELLLSYKGIRADLIRYEQYTSEIMQYMDDIKPEIIELYQLSSGVEDAENIWGFNDYDKETMDELMKKKRMLPDEIFEIKELQRDLLSTIKTVKTINRFINDRTQISREIPSIIPNSGHISSLFGWRRSPFGHGRDFHTGIDIAAGVGTSIFATAPGRVASAGWSGGYGNSVRIVHKYGYETIYAHMSAIAVSTGKEVKRGDRIGYVGSTGNTTGSHCHYEIRLGNIPINPYPYMSKMW